MVAIAKIIQTTTEDVGTHQKLKQVDPVEIKSGGTKEKVGNQIKA
jgi:hypothetical protein